MKKSILIGMATFTLCAFSPSVFAATYYVSKAGSDSNPGTIEQPWATIAKANLTLQAGDTACIQAGTYDEEIKPTNNGNPTNGYITYTNYNDERVLIDRNYDGYGANLRAREYINIDGIDFNRCYKFITTGSSDAPGFNHCIVQNCRMTYAGSGGILMNTGCNYNKFLNNYIKVQTQEQLDANIEWEAFWIGNHEGKSPSNHNLIEGNEILNAGAYGIVCTNDYNVIRNNIIHDCGDKGLSIYFFAHRNLVEDNVFYRAGVGPDGHGYDVHFFSANNTIFRHNVLYDDWNGPGGELLSMWSRTDIGVSHDNRVYSNVLYGGHNWGMSLGHDPGEYYTRDNYFKNNIIYKNKVYTIHFYSYSDNPVWPPYEGILFDHNLISTGISSGGVVRFFCQGQNFTLAGAESSYPNVFMNNVEGDPLFVGESARDFRLQAGSPAIDTGTYLTVTVDSGAGTQMQVKDAGYFCDGFSIVDADFIQLEGQTQRARVVGIDYDNNIITIDRTLSWHANQGVSVPYNGSAPDLGAFEYGNANPVSAQANATPTSGEAPLSVNFTADATGGNLPYTYSWDLGDGESSNVQNLSHVYQEAGSYTAALTVTDGVANEDTDTIEIVVSGEATPPVGTISINQGALTTNSTSVTLALSATDEQSGMGEGAEMQLSNDNITWSNPEPYTSSRDWILTDGDGVKTVYVRYKDAAGNWMPIAVTDEITLDTSPSSSLVYCTFEEGDDGWSGAVRETAYMRSDSVSYAGQYSMEVSATGTPSYLTIDIRPAGWELERYPYVEFAYKIPNAVPVGLFFQTNDGWICLGGTNTHDHGSYAANDSQMLIDDNAWHVININARDTIRETYPAADSVSEFEWFTFGAQQGDRFWFDEFRILAGVSDDIPPTASITLEPGSPLKAETAFVTLTTSENVVSVPTPLSVLESDNSTATVDLTGQVPGNTFTGTWVVDNSVAEGMVTFSLPEDALADEAGNKGNEITSGQTAIIDRTAPMPPDQLLITE